MLDRYQAYMNKDIVIKPTRSGTLSDHTFSVKDVFAVSGHTNAAGNPAWLNTHQPAIEHAPVIDTLLNQGAAMEGITHTDELMYSLNGENIHYGTPINPQAEKYIPGGSSSGSAVAVAGKQVDFALGTDTGGSVRIPSSYCGLYGFRPTHGAVDISEVIPLAPSFDTVGWMARSSQMLLNIGEVLVPDQRKNDSSFSRLMISEDARELLLPEALQRFSGVFSWLSDKHERTETIRVAEEGLSLWFQTFKLLQAQEIWRQHGEWIENEVPRFGPGIEERFSWARTLENEDLTDWIRQRETITRTMEETLGVDGVLVIPTTPGGPPERNTRQGDLQDLRSRTMQLSCIAGLAGLPQVTLPLGKLHGLPIGVSMIANRGQDLKLLSWANQMSPVSTEEWSEIH